MTADPLSVALDAWHDACHQGVTIKQGMQHVLDALTAAGLSVVPTATMQYARICEDPSMQGPAAIGRVAVLRDRDPKVGLPGWPLYSRHVGPWVPVADQPSDAAQNDARQDDNQQSD